MIRPSLSLPVLLLGAGLLAIPAACSKTKGRPPVARIQVTPRYIPTGVETQVTLDAHRSCDELDAPETCDKTSDGPGPPGGCPGGVTFSWELDVPFLALGDLNAPKVDVLVTPDRPISVIVTVTDCDDNSTSARTTIGITTPYPSGGADAGVP